MSTKQSGPVYKMIKLYRVLDDDEKALIRNKFCKDFNVNRQTFMNRLRKPTAEDLVYWKKVFSVARIEDLIEHSEAETKAMPLKSIQERREREDNKSRHLLNAGLS